MVLDGVAGCSLWLMPVLTEMADYDGWRQRHRQWRARARPPVPLGGNPLFSVVVDSEAGDSSALANTVESLLAQTFANVEVTLCGVARDATEARHPDLARWTNLGFRIRGLVWEPDRTAVHALSSALAGACAPVTRGDFVMCVPAGTTFDADCFAEICHTMDSCDLEQDPSLVLIDHDRAVAGDGAPVPHLLWHWGLDQLLEEDLVGASFAVSRECITRRGGPPCTHVREWLLALMSEGVEPDVVHVAAPVVHLPAPASPRSTGPEFPASRSRVGAWPRNVARIDPRAREGVSVIIPTRNHAELLRECVRGLGDADRDLELIVVDNGSDERDAADLLRELETQGAATVLRYPGPFNFSRLVNRGVAASKHPTLMLLNSDVRIGSWRQVAHVVDYVWRDGVGVVGTTLHYPDGAIQHAGVFIRSCDAAHHVMRGAVPGSAGYALAHAHPRSLQAVTGALMAIRREVFHAIKGFDEGHLPVEWNDIDFCLRARSAGWRVVCVPAQGVVHDERATRGMQDTAQVLQMRRDAQRHMAAAWDQCGLRLPLARASIAIEDVDRPMLREPG